MNNIVTNCMDTNTKKKNTLYYYYIYRRRRGFLLIATNKSLPSKTKIHNLIVRFPAHLYLCLLEVCTNLTAAAVNFFDHYLARQRQIPNPCSDSEVKLSQAIAIMPSYFSHVLSLRKKEHKNIALVYTYTS